jgi:hypothetical protein
VGITGFVLIAQSHLNIHTFPRRGFVSADAYTCQDRLDHASIWASLIAAFELGEIESNHPAACATRWSISTTPASPARRMRHEFRSGAGGGTPACCALAAADARARPPTARAMMAPDRRPRADLRRCVLG